MVRDVTLGQYYPAESVIHRMDPRSKIIMLIAYIVLIFCTSNFYSLAIASLFTLLFILLSGVPVKIYVKSLKVIFVVVLLTSVINLFYGTGAPILEFGVLKITMNGIYRSIFVSIRIVCLILVSSCLTFTTSPTELTDAIERLMKPLNKIHFPVHEIAMMMTLALRFVPTILEETDKIMQAQKSRGADMESGGIIKRVKAFVPILIPLFASAFRRAIEVATAMECRCYQGGTGRTRMKVIHMSKRDVLAFISVGIVTCGVIICNILVRPII